MKDVIVLGSWYGSACSVLLSIDKYLLICTIKHRQTSSNVKCCNSLRFFVWTCMFCINNHKQTSSNVNINNGQTFSNVKCLN